MMTLKELLSLPMLNLTICCDVEKKGIVYRTQISTKKEQIFDFSYQYQNEVFYEDFDHFKYIFSNEFLNKEIDDLTVEQPNRALVRLRLEDCDDRSETS